MASYALKIFTQITFDILYFPVWWYSVGIIKNLKWIKNFLVQKERGLALLVWIKNILTPMYGQRDVVGYIISIFMRIIQIILRGIVMIFWFGFVLAEFLFWIFLPIAVGYQIVFQFL